MSFGHSHALKANSELEASVLRVAGVPSVGLETQRKLLSGPGFYNKEYLQMRRTRKSALHKHIF